MPDVSNSNIQDILALMMKKELYLISNTCVVEPSAMKDHLAAHIQYVIDLEKAGILFASGPLFDEDGEMTGDGITIVRASNFQEAQGIAERDPFKIAGLREARVRRWIVNEGRISLSVDLSDCRGTLP